MRLLEGSYLSDVERSVCSSVLMTTTDEDKTTRFRISVHLERETFTLVLGN